MSIVIFSGTTEGRELSNYLSEKKIEHYVCVATESGELVMDRNSYAKIHVGRMDSGSMEQFVRGNQATLVIDATHPYAVEVTQNIQMVCSKLSIKYIRVNREDETTLPDTEEYCYYENTPECAETLCETEGNILLTTGSKELACYAQKEQLKNRLYVRVLPNREAMECCRENGIDERHIIAMYGPHSLEMNVATIKQFQIAHVVTKQSGHIGGYDEKMEAAKQTGSRLHIIKRPTEGYGCSIEHCKDIIWHELGLNSPEKVSTREISISLVGIGMGGDDSITIAGSRAIEESDMVFGAGRMLAFYKGLALKFPFYLAEDIKKAILDNMAQIDKKQIKIAVLFSGDTGVYSGADKVYKNLSAWELCKDIRIFPGISSYSAFASKLGSNYTDALLLSLHGKAEDMDNRCKIKEAIAQGKTSYVLMSGKEDFVILKELILEMTSNSIPVDIGYELSYDTEQIIHTDSEKMLAKVDAMQDGLFIVRLNNRD